MILSPRSRLQRLRALWCGFLDAGAGVLRSCANSSPLRSIYGFAGFAVGGVLVRDIHPAIRCILPFNCRGHCRMGFRHPLGSGDETGFNRILGGCGVHNLNGRKNYLPSELKVS